MKYRKLYFGSGNAQSIEANEGDDVTMVQIGWSPFKAGIAAGFLIGIVFTGIIVKIGMYSLQ